MKVPKSAKMVFQGKLFEVYQWKQRMFDNSYETFEMIKRPDTVSIIPVVDGKILLNKEKQPNLKKEAYTLPGGRVDKNENPLEAAKRELFEETGYTSDDWELINVTSPTHKIEWNIFVYLARECRKTGKPKLDAGEKIKTLTVDFKTFINIVQDGHFWGKDFSLYIFRLEKNKKEFQKFKERLLG